MDLFERVKGAVKGNSWLMGVPRVLFQQKAPLDRGFCFSDLNIGRLCNANLVRTLSVPRSHSISSWPGERIE